MEIESTLGNVQSALTSMAIVAGGIWAYFKFIRSRLFHAKIEIQLDAEFAFGVSEDVVVASVQVKNVGFTKASFELDICSLEVCLSEFRPQLDFTDAARWRQVATIPILYHHHWLEPGETAREQEAITLHDRVDLAARLVAVVSNGQSLWKASTVLAKGVEKREEG